MTRILRARGHFTGGVPKKRYQLAHQAAHARKRLASETGVEVDIYRCRSCSMFHVGKRWTARAVKARQANYEEVLVGKLVYALRLVLDHGLTR